MKHLAQQVSSNKNVIFGLHDYFTDNYEVRKEQERQRNMNQHQRDIERVRNLDRQRERVMKNNEDIIPIPIDEYRNYIPPVDNNMPIENNLYQEIKPIQENSIQLPPPIQDNLPDDISFSNNLHKNHRKPVEGYSKVRHGKARERQIQREKKMKDLKEGKLILNPLTGQLIGGPP